MDNISELIRNDFNIIDERLFSLYEKCYNSEKPILDLDHLFTWFRYGHSKDEFINDILKIYFTENIDYEIIIQNESKNIKLYLTYDCFVGICMIINRDISNYIKKIHKSHIKIIKNENERLYKEYNKLLSKLEFIEKKRDIIPE